jgi:hypothetical protein
VLRQDKSWKTFWRFYTSRLVLSLNVAKPNLSDDEDEEEEPNLFFSSTAVAERAR